MKKYTLKAQLMDNTVTVDNPDDKILSPISSDTYTLDDILELMHQEDTGLRTETLRHVTDLFLRINERLLLSGNSVNTGLYYASASLRGTIEGGVWNPERNSIQVNFTQGKALREAIADTAVEIIGEKGSSIYINSGLNVATRAPGYTATAGRNFTLTGKNIRVVGTDPAVGITLTSASNTVTKIAEDMIAVNEPSKVMILIPAGLADGVYTLTLTTQYASGGKLLSMPRSVSQSITIGEAPSGGGSGEGGDGGLDENPFG